MAGHESTPGCTDWIPAHGAHGRKRLFPCPRWFVMADSAHRGSGHAAASAAAAADRRGDVAVPRAHPVLGAGHPHAEAVVLAVGAARRAEAEQILAVQLLRDPRRRL